MGLVRVECTMQVFERVRCRVVPALVAVISLAAPGVAASQTMEGTGAVATGLLLRQMDGVKRVLMIGAHPDDEDTSLLTTLARGWGAETAYLSLTRGDGGQNRIGPELWEGLGVVRTGELLAARKLDGGDQFFTRAFDYGYSKTAEEALSLWPRDELLADVVWVVRKYRPQVIVSVFSGTPRDGHGQHQAAGIMAREAFAAAGDPTRFPEHFASGVEAWTPAKLYQSSWRRLFPGAQDEDDGSLDIETGRLDPLLGRSWLQLSMESRSQHRSQDMGSAQPAGPSQTGVILVESRVRDVGQEIFSGIDTTLVGLTDDLPDEGAGEARPHLEAYRASVYRAIDGFGLDPAGIAPELMEAMAHITAARDAVGVGAELEFDLATAKKQDVVSRALMAAAGVSFDVRSTDDLLVPGQTVQVSARLWNGGPYTLSVPEAVLKAPNGWEVEETSVDGVSRDGRVAPGAVVTWTFDVHIPEDADVSRLYYLRAAREGARYRWPKDATLWALPRDPVSVTGGVSFTFLVDGEASGSRQRISAGWRYVGVDPAFGELEKPVLIVPAVSVGVTPAGMAWPQRRSASRTVSVVVRSEAEGGSSGEVSMSAPSGWTATPASRPFELAEAGAERAITFEIRPDASVSAGRYTFEVAAATTDRRSYDEGYALIDYGHIERAALFSPAQVTVSVVPVAVTEGLRVGYIMGTGDDGPEAIRQMGADVELLDEATIRDGAFGGFGTIVLGVRAYETRSDLRAAAGQLLDFARDGGTVIVQYNRGPLGSLAPYDLQVGRGSPRVADETAPMRILEPDAPIFTTPNRITDADFEGWVQERGLYFASEWDDRYLPVLALNDPGEEARRGSVLIAFVGDGVFAYAALSFFRQWAAQVPGAYRLFANLISLDADQWNAFAGSR
jgi:LmbE family N-acetylglucosaminyl deacetylase